MKKLLKNKKGFTLVEVIVVLVIIAILIAIAVPSVMKYIDDANEAKYFAQARGAMISAEGEIIEDYADDKDVDLATVSGNVATEIGIVGVEISAFTDKEGTVAYVSTADAPVSPNKIKSYKVKLSDTVTVLIVVNGTASIVE